MRRSTNNVEVAAQARQSSKHPARQAAAAARAAVHGTLAGRSASLDAVATAVGRVDGGERGTTLVVILCVIRDVTVVVILCVIRDVTVVAVSFLGLAAEAVVAEPERFEVREAVQAMRCQPLEPVVAEVEVPELWQP